MSKIIISKLIKYPAEEPTGFAVGFTVTTESNRTFYIDTLVSFDLATTDEQAVAIAYTNLQATIASQVAALDAKSNLLGTEYIPA